MTAMPQKTISRLNTLKDAVEMAKVIIGMVVITGFGTSIYAATQGHFSSVVPVVLIIVFLVSLFSILVAYGVCAKFQDGSCSKSD